MTTIGLLAALRRVLDARCGRMGHEVVDLGNARGRYLATELRTTGPWPSTDRSAMDGFAVFAGEGLAAGARLPVVGQSLAGRPFDGALGKGAAIRIMTGAVVPAGADAVVPVEGTSGFDGDEVEVRVAVQAGQNIRPCGSEVAADQIVLAAGTRIRAAEIGVLAVLGAAEVPVHRRPRVGIVATGDEVVPVDSAPLPHQVRESNSWALAAQIDECGALPVRLGVAPDEPLALQRLLRTGLDTCDVLVTIGGISKGSHDLVHGTLSQLAVATDFHGIELKPGKPTYFGQRQRDDRTVFVFGLPGNPASSFTVFDLLVRPLLLRLLGQDPQPWSATARIRGRFKANSRLQAVPVSLHTDGTTLVADLQPPTPSGDPFSLVGGNAYALLPANCRPGELEQATIVGYSAGERLA
ncbi:MAG: gephyrin-like molybdotransferase Glp [Planctomycetota bacterium]